MRTWGFVIAAFGGLLVLGCGGRTAWEKAPEGILPLGYSGGPTEHEYMLAVGDRIELRVPFYKEFQAQAVVRPDGKVTFPFVGEITAAGYTPSQLDSIVTSKLSEVIVGPRASVIVVEYTDQLVYVLGEVAKPGAYPVYSGMTASQALTSAGGPTTFARLTDVILIRRDSPNSVRGAKVDLKRFLEGRDPMSDPYIAAQDIVYVPRTKIGKVAVFLDSFFKGMTYPTTVIARGYEIEREAR